MDNNELLRRAEDLLGRCERSSCVTNTLFLTPAESYQLDCWAKRRAGCRLIIRGGGTDCERTVGFFLPDYMEEECFDESEYIFAMRLKAHFGEPGHRDYMGAILGMGIGREWLGDIQVHGDTAYVFCLSSVFRHLLSIDKVGRYSVTAEEISLKDVPKAEKQIKPVSFSVMSMRLDAVAAGMFNLSRTEAARLVNEGLVAVNYSPCIKTDHQVSEGDIISLRGAGKGTVTGTGGTSRKGRLFVYADIYK